MNDEAHGIECICCGAFSAGQSLCQECKTSERGNVTTIRYKATPTGTRFHRSKARIRLMLGPIGSGKSVTCCWEILKKSLEQKKGHDGIRHTRWAIVRNTYPELKTTTIKTWLDWFPEDIFGPIRWDIPITHHVHFNDVHMEIIFLALDRPKDVKKLLSLELTGIWYNECREIEEEMIEAGDGRIGRFPSKRDGGPSWYGILMDTNYPDDSHWIYRNVEEEQPETWEAFKQPPGLIKIAPGEYVPNPEAENIGNLPDGYYINLVPGKRQAWIDVYVLCKYATIVDGKPVYPEYNDYVHAANGILMPYRGLPLLTGWDFGLNPSVVMFQISPRGVVRALDEIVGDGMGLRQMIDNCFIPLLASEYNGFKVRGWGDPAGVARAETDEQTCFQILDEYFGREFIRPAPSNKFQRRRDAVANNLTKMIDGGPAMVISSKCKILRRGFRGAYRYRRLQVAGEARYSLEPEKSITSHPHDGFQYGCLGATEPEVYTPTVESYRARLQPTPSRAGY